MIGGGIGGGIGSTYPSFGGKRFGSMSGGIGGFSGMYIIK